MDFINYEKLVGFKEINKDWKQLDSQTKKKINLKNVKQNMKPYKQHCRKNNLLGIQVLIKTKY